MAIGKRKPPVALIAGATASGKSALALAFAKSVGGAIVNADSAQLYRELPLLSAAPTAAERAEVEHRLFGVLDGADASSAAEWAALARREIADLHAAGRLPILVGGTGLYLRTLLDGIAPVPHIDAAVRSEVRAASVAVNLARLRALDQGGAEKLKPSDSTRIARALEVVVSTGRTLAEWQARREGGIAAEIELRPLILLPPRKWLYQRCDERLIKMIDDGAVAEVEALLARGLDPQLPVMRAIGVREIAAYLQGDATLDEAVVAAQQATRRYAKRQYTWFSHQPPPEWPRFREPLDVDRLGEALALLGTKG
jgi:tRNA dimethylallyltransferase